MPAAARAACGRARRPSMTAPRRPPTNVTLAPLDNRALANLCGPLDANLRQIEAALDVTIARRGGDVHASRGDPAQAARAARGAASASTRRAAKPLSVDDIQLGPGRDHDAARDAAGRRRATTARRCCARAAPTCTAARRTRSRTCKHIQAHDITFGIGPAGTGKTYLAVACAVDALERDAVKRIVLVRPAVEAGERLGFLPGDLAQKVDPYLRPLYDALYDLMGFDKVGEALRAAARSRSRRSPTCAGARSTTRSSSSTRRRTRRPSR